MAVVYSTLANGGWRVDPIAITKVVFPGGHVDSNWGQPHRTRALSPGVTGEETRILRMNVEQGTAVRSRINCPTAAKTGTTSELVDAWLDGYNSEYTTIVWMGYPNRRVPMTDVHGEPQQGGALPAQIWHDYMSAVTAGHPCAPLHESNAGLSFQPFYGKYASTGGRFGNESEGAPESAPAPGARHAAPHRGKHEPPAVEVQETPPPSTPPPAPKSEAPSGPPTATPVEPQTGGASP
jgi:membrane peptidoglycan carboxypeptidase